MTNNENTTENTYIVFYRYFDLNDDGYGWLENIEVPRTKNSLIDMVELTKTIQEKLMEEDKLSSEGKAIITNIIDQRKI